MSLLNSPDPAVRAAVVQQDLGNVLHPIVQHKALETKQMVVTRKRGRPARSNPVRGRVGGDQHV